MKRHTGTTLAAMCLLLFLSTACQSVLPPGDIHVTFANNRCDFDGPRMFGPVKQSILATAETSDITYLLFAVTLDDGKTIDDLWNLDLSYHPVWLHKINYLSAVLRGKAERLTIDLRSGTFYLFCASSHSEQVIGAFGPIEIR